MPGPVAGWTPLIGNSQHGLGSYRAGHDAGAAMLRADHEPAPALGDTAFSEAVRQPQANYAALDLGTNNCRLLVARPARGGFRVIDAFSRIVRLGEGLSTTGGLSEAAMARTIEALRVCAGKLGQRKVMAGRYVATEACRRAENCTEFLDRVRDIRREVRARQVQMLGSSGTVTTLAGVHLALPRYVRAFVDGSMLTFDQIELVSRHLAGLDIEGRAANPCVGRERADLVLSGCAILDAICSTWPVGRLRVADRGIREGILFELMQGAPE